MRTRTAGEPITSVGCAAPSAPCADDRESIRRCEITNTNEYGEVDHGRIPDDLAWSLTLDDATQVVGAFQVIHARGESSGGPRAVARSGGIGMYVRAFADGKGENGLHSHPTDAIWIVLEGAATFHGMNETLLGELNAKEGILVPAGESYRFRCNGPSVLARISVADTESGSG